MTDSRLTLEFCAFIAALVFVTISLGLLAGHDAAEFIQSRTADLAQVVFSEGR